MQHVEQELNQYEKRINEGDEAECRSLWISVILQAVLDAKGKYGNAITQSQAKAWLEAKAEDRSEFATVCGLAGINWEKAKIRCRALLEKDGASIDFRTMKREKEANRTVANHKRYLRRVEKCRRLKMSQNLIRLDHVVGNEATNENQLLPANDN